MNTNETMNTYRMSARMFGLFFIVAFLSYGIGTGLIESLTSVPDMLASVYANKTQLIIGAILMALVHSFVNIGLPVIMLPILKPGNKNLAYGYLSAGITATIVLIMGVIFLLLLLPLSDEYVRTGSVNSAQFETLAIVLAKGNFFAYQLGMAIWGLGGLMFCTLLYQSKLVPRLITISGFIGYVIFIAGTILELFGYNIGVLLAMPGGLFEIALSLWLIFRGFNLEALNSTETKTEQNQDNLSLSPA